MNSASPCSLAGRYDNPLPPRFLAPIEFLKIPAQYSTYPKENSPDYMIKQRKDSSGRKSLKHCGNLKKNENIKKNPQE
jgi:hypothetical protein